MSFTVRFEELLGYSDQERAKWRESMTRRKLAFHILLHEVRHLAQIAYAARLAGHEPPGRHDLFYFTEFA